MMGFTTRDVASLLDLPERRIRACARAGVITPARGPHNRYVYSFQDLVLLRTAADLWRAKVPMRRVIESLAQLKSSLPFGRSLTALRIRASGNEVVVHDDNEPPWNPTSRQFHIDFDNNADDAAMRSEPVVHVTARAGDDGDALSAAEWFQMGVDLEASQPDAARAAYERALDLEPDLAEPRVNLGRLLHEAGRRADAEAEYRRVLAHGDHALAAYNLGVLLEDMGRTTDAIQSYARAIAADPLLAEAHYNLARLYEQSGDRRSAIRYFNGYRALVRAE